MALYIRIRKFQTDSNSKEKKKKEWGDKNIFKKCKPTGFEVKQCCSKGGGTFVRKKKTELKQIKTRNYHAENIYKYIYIYRERRQAHLQSQFQRSTNLWMSYYESKLRFANP